MKKIALDLDGVVFDSENLYRVYTEIYDVEIFHKDSLIDNTKRVYQKRYDWSQEVCEEFYKENAPHVLKTANVMTGAEIVLPKLMQYFEVVIVTSRSDIEVGYAKEKLSALGLSNIEIFHSKADKISTLLEQKADYIIDDDENTCLEASKEAIHAIYFKNAAANQIPENEYLKIVNNWGEIYKYLMLKECEDYIE